MGDFLQTFTSLAKCVGVNEEDNFNAYRQIKYMEVIESKWLYQGYCYSYKVKPILVDPPAAFWCLSGLFKPNAEPVMQSGSCTSLQ